MKLSLGTVQFGLAYGIAGRDTPVEPAIVRNILELAQSAGITTLDTAAAYGDIEERLERDTEIDAAVPSDDELVQVGRLMRTLREARGYTQREVQGLSGVDQGEISRIESGVGSRGMTISQMSTLARAQHARVVMILVDESAVESGNESELKIDLEDQIELARVIL